MTNIVEATDLSKSYNGNVVVDRLNLKIPGQQIFGLLGPNGAGKTTTILMLLGLTEPTGGSIRLGGFDPVSEPLKVKRITGYMPEKLGFYDGLTAYQNLDLIAEFNGIGTAEAREISHDLLQKVGLAEVADKPVGTYSKGMKQRLGIADVLVKRPSVVILDEPTSGLDPAGINEILDLIQDLPKSGASVIMSSHRLYEVERVCHRVGILAKGALIAEGSLDELGRGARTGGKYRIDVTTGEPAVAVSEDIRRLDGVNTVTVDGMNMSVSADVDVRAEIVKTITGRGISMLEIKMVETTLDEIYLNYFRDGGEAGPTGPSA
jgi:ABC-2 type transport system ATP-binding protein